MTGGASLDFRRAVGVSMTCGCPPPRRGVGDVNTTSARTHIAVVTTALIPDTDADPDDPPALAAIDISTPGASDEPSDDPELATNPP